MVSSPKPPADFAYEFDLLLRLERSIVDGVPLVNVPFMGRYTLWHRFRQYVFSSDIRRFAETKSFYSYVQGEGSGFSAKGFLVSLFGATYSLFSIFVAFVTSPEVILFGIDRISDKRYTCDFRTSALYAFLKKHRVHFAECLHTVFNKKFLSNLFLRMRPTVYLEAPDILYSVLQMFRFTRRVPERVISGITNCTEDEERFIRYVLKKYLGQEGLVHFRVGFFKLFLKASGARAIFAIDDARYYQDISLAGHETGIPVYAFQHGHFTKYHPGWLGNGTTLEYMQPSVLVLASEYWKNTLLALGGSFPKEALLVGGAMRPSVVALPEQHAEGITILIPHETDSPKKEMSAFVKKILDAMPDARIVLKLRPDYSKAEQVAEYEGIVESKRFFTIVDLKELSERPDVAIGVYSSFLYDMVEAKVPVGIADVSNDFGRGMVDNGLADRIRTDSKMANTIRTLADLPASEIEERRKHLVFPGTLFEDTLSGIIAKEGILSNGK